MSDFAALIKDLEKHVVDETNKITARLRTGMAEKTPVKTGYHKSRWKVENQIKQVGETARITNDGPVIEILNSGDKDRTGNYMVERTIQEVGKDYQ